MTYKEFLIDYNGETVGFPDGKYVGECLSLVKKYIQLCYGINPPPSGTNSAYGYWTNFPSPLNTVFDKVENTDTTIPKMGWIAIWKPWASNPYGHISIVSDDNATTSFFNSLDSNWGSRVAQVIKHDYDDVVGFLVPKVINQPTMDTISQLIKDNNLVEGDIRWLIDLKKNDTVRNLEKQIATLQESAKISASTINDLTGKLADFQKSEKEWQSTLKSAQEDLVKMTEDRNAVSIRYKAKNDEYNALLAKTSDPVELIKLFIQLIKK